LLQSRQNERLNYLWNAKAFMGKEMEAGVEGGQRGMRQIWNYKELTGSYHLHKYVTWVGLEGEKEI
jgi:hypothetical protein